MMRLLLCILILLAANQVLGRSLQEIQRSGELRLCVAGTSASFYEENGEDFARYLGVRAKTEKLASWDQQFHNAGGVTVQNATYEPAALAGGRCDLYPNDLHISAWRKQKMALVPYFVTRNVIVTRPELRDVLREPRDLAGHSAAVQAGTEYEAWLRELNRTTLANLPVVIQTAPTEQSVRRVAERSAEFTVIAAETAFKLVRDDLKNLDLLFAVGDSTEVGWGVSRDAEDLQQALKQYFSASRRVGSRLDLSWRHQYGVSLQEYSLFSASFDSSNRLKEFLSTWGLPAGSALAGVLFAMFFWMHRLRREVTQHRLAAQALRNSQEMMSQEVKRRQAVSDLLLAVQQAAALQEFCQIVLHEIARQLPLGQALFASVGEGRQIMAQAHYAGSGENPSTTLQELPATMSLIERCVITGEPVLVMPEGDTYLHILFGFGRAKPVAILLLPIRHSGHVLAIVELAVLKPFTADQRQLLDEFEPVIAVSLRRFLHEQETA